MTDTQSFTEMLVEAGRAAAADAIEIDPLAIAVIVEASLAAVLPLVAAEGRQVQAAYEIVRDERDWWKARAERAKAALREARRMLDEGPHFGCQPIFDLIDAALTHKEK
jgi:hypothetical protein